MQLGLNSLCFDAMAPSFRPHPYRATSTVNTPEGPRTSAWLAGHGGLPGRLGPSSHLDPSWSLWIIPLYKN